MYRPILFRQILSIPRNVVIVTVVGLIVRVLLAPFTSHPYDMGIFYAITQQIIKGEMPFWGLGGIPMFYYTLVPVSLLYELLAGPLNVHPIVISSLPPIVQGALGWVTPGNGLTLVIPDWFYNLLVKIPLIISDFFVGIVLYRMVGERYGERAAFISFCLWFLNPMVVWVSGGWGMFDSLPALFSILATYFVLKRSYSLGAICLAIGVGYKLYPLLLLVPLVAYSVRIEGNLAKFARPALIFVFTLLVLFLPLVPQLIQGSSAILGSQPSNPSTNPSSTFGLTYWSIAPFTSISGSAVSLISTLLLILSVIIVGVVAAIKVRSIEALFFWELASLSTVFFSYPRVNEQWFLWLLPFLILISQSKSRRAVVVGLSLLAVFYLWINSLFTAFFVTDYYLAPNQLTLLAKWTTSLSAYRLSVMAILGVAFSAALLLFLFKWKNYLPAIINNSPNLSASVQNSKGSSTISTDS